MKLLQGALSSAHKLLAEAEGSSQTAQQVVNEKTQLLDAAKQRVESLKSENTKAHTDLTKTKEAADKAEQSAKSAKDNASRNRRKLRAMHE